MSWTASGGTSVTHVLYNGAVYTDVAAIWNTTGLVLYQYPDSALGPQDSSLKINLMNLPPHN
jgi:hypothetical protein